MIDTSNLREKLEGLRGIDVCAAEAEERRAGSTFPDVTFTKTFQARLAAMALEVPYEDIQELPIKKYLAVCQDVFNFLFETSGGKTP